MNKNDLLLLIKIAVSLLDMGEQKKATKILKIALNSKL